MATPTANLRDAVTMIIPAFLAGIIVLYLVPIVRKQLEGVEFARKALSYRPVQILLVGFITLIGIAGGTYVVRKVV